MSKTLYSKEQKKLIENLKLARKLAGLDQVIVAKKIGRTQSYISKIESGQRKIDIVQLSELAKIYRKPLEYFIK